jgi:UDP-2,3-diacylglucosamine hydrolase
MSNHTVFFISDAHFGIPVEGGEGREKHFEDLLNNAAQNLTDLYIIGDLFDFWIEYRYVIRSDYFSVLCCLKRLVDCGVKVHYLAGNHDFALGSFLKENIGISIYQNSLEVQIQGKKVYMFHGDGLIKRDFGYRILKKILRNPLNQRIYKLLHPDWGVTIGSFCSGSSRKYLRKSLSESIKKEYREHAKKHLEAGNDLVIFGHTHHAELCRFDSGIYLNTGSWLINYNYASMTDGEVSLKKYTVSK